MSRLVLSRAGNSSIELTILGCAFSLVWLTTMVSDIADELYASQMDPRYDGELQSEVRNVLLS